MSGRLVSCTWSRLVCSCRPHLLGRTSLTRYGTPLLRRDTLLARNYATAEPATGYRFSESHEWTSLDGTKATIGVTNYAQDKLGDVVYVELPEVGQELAVEDVFGVLESVKAASDLNSPFDGKVVDINSQLTDSPELINKEPYGEGWLMKVELKDTTQYDQLMTQEEYIKFLEKEDS